jgi:hypothetical protein
LLASLARTGYGRDDLRDLLMRLDVEGYVTVDDWADDDLLVTFRNPLLRRWWIKFGARD